MNGMVKVFSVGFMIMFLLFSFLGCSKERSLSPSHETESITKISVDTKTNEEIRGVINNWAVYINDQEYEKAFSLYVRIPSPDELKTIKELYSKSFKSFKLKDVKLNEEYCKRYGNKNGVLVYIAYFETEFTETNLTAYEDDPMRFVIMKKVGGVWRINNMATGL